MLKLVLSPSFKKTVTFPRNRVYFPLRTASATAVTRECHCSDSEAISAISRRKIALESQ